MLRPIALCLVTCVTLPLVGCGSGTSVELVDLDKVLDICETTLTELDGNDQSVEAAAVVTAESADGESVAVEVAAEPVAADPEKEKQFVDAFRKNLNNAKLMSTPIGIAMNSAGEIEGFSDADGNNIRSGSDRSLFKIEIDAERNRLIASDMQGHSRDHRYRPRFGFFTGYMLGSMFRSQSGYYSGARASSKPRYGQMSMAPKGYHQAAVTKARAAAKASSAASARSKTGSRSFSFGK